MTEATMTIQQFGAQVKTKYPAYSQYSDEDIGNRMLQKYPVYKDRVTGAPAATGAFTPKAPALSANKQADLESAQKYGAWAPASTESPSIIGEPAKVVANLAPSAFNFVKGAIDLFNPISTYKKVKQAVTEFQGLASDVGDYGKAFGALGKELPKAAYETLVPEAGRAIIGGDLETAQRAIVNDPVGQIAPFLLAARGGAGALDRAGVTKGAGAAFDTTVSKVAAPVTKSAGYVFRGVKNMAESATKFAAGQATGLNPETITQVIKKPEAFTKEARGIVDRAALGKEVQSVLGKKAATLSETGEAYAPIREGDSSVKVSKNWLDSTIKDLTNLDIKKGKLKSSGSSVLREASDVRAMQHIYDLWKPTFQKGTMTANEFLNFRTDLAKISRFERQIGKSQPLESMAKIARGRFNEAYRPQLEGLDAIDKTFSAQTVELSRLSKGFVDKNGNLTDAAINRIANATGKGKDLLLNRLEETVPGITGKIKVLKAVEDIQAASGIKVGTYGRAAITGGAFFLGGPIQAIITAVLTSPELAVPLLRRYGLIKNSNAVTAVVNALKKGATTINQLPNRPPAVLSKDVTEIKPKIGLGIEDVSGGKPSAFKIKQNTKLQPLEGYQGKMDRMHVVVNKTLKDSPELASKIWTGHGGAAWTKGGYISDNLFTTKLTTPKGLYSYDEIHGLRLEKAGSQTWNERIKTAQATIKGKETAMTPEQSENFLNQNKQGAFSPKAPGEAATPKTAAQSLFRGGGEGAMPKGMTAADVLNYERTQLGNADIKPVAGIDLKKIKSDNLQWLTTTKKAASNYGEVAGVKGNFRVIAKDSEGGVLVEKKPTAGAFGAKPQALYHGTNDIRWVQKGEAIKKSETSTMGNPGVFFAKKASEAESWITASGGYHQATQKGLTGGVVQLTKKGADQFNLKKMTEAKYEQTWLKTMDELRANPEKFGVMDKYGIHESAGWKIVEDRLRNQGYDGVDFGNSGVLFDPEQINATIKSLRESKRTNFGK